MQKLIIEPTGLAGLKVIQPNSVEDDRGKFSRIFCHDELKEVFKSEIKQINHSVTKNKGTVRGLHFQYEPYAEIKMVKCIRGSVLDIVVDIRKDSPTFLQHFTIELTEQNQKMIYISKGFAHGFQTLKNNAELLYLHSNLYSPQGEGALNIKDPILNISLPLEISCISEKDNTHPFIDKSFEGIEVNEM